MRALQFGRFGIPQDTLYLAEVPTPEPNDHQVRVRVTHRSINPSDLAVIHGRYGSLPSELPATPGMECMGHIDQVGSAVNGWQIGQRVVPLGTQGTWSEYVVVAPQQLVPVHDHVSDQAAAQFIVNPVTAWVMLTHELNLQPGEWVLQNAAGSTLGRLVIQLAKLNGFKTVNFVRRREQVAELLALGADAVICTEDNNVVEQVMALTDGGVTGAIDAVGGATVR